mmetsp:Transcript_81652/g.231452  ORF Transcript_81652/g.231452 Transcript_81652/m.231452 type:complete len:412 (+) Transcript_81652:581-1816(+)
MAPREPLPVAHRPRRCVHRRLLRVGWCWGLGGAVYRWRRGDGRGYHALRSRALVPHGEPGHEGWADAPSGDRRCGGSPRRLRGLPGALRVPAGHPGGAQLERLGGRLRELDARPHTPVAHHGRNSRRHGPHHVEKACPLDIGALVRGPPGDLRGRLPRELRLGRGGRQGQGRRVPPAAGDVLVRRDRGPAGRRGARGALHLRGVRAGPPQLQRRAPHPRRHMPHPLHPDHHGYLRPVRGRRQGAPVPVVGGGKPRLAVAGARLCRVGSHHRRCGLAAAGPAAGLGRAPLLEGLLRQGRPPVPVHGAARGRAGGDRPRGVHVPGGGQRVVEVFPRPAEQGAGPGPPGILSPPPQPPPPPQQPRPQQQQREPQQRRRPPPRRCAVTTPRRRARSRRAVRTAGSRGMPLINARR